MKRDLRLRLVPPPPAEKAAEREDEPFTEQEREGAAALREAMDRGDEPLAAALRAAWAPSALDEGDLSAIVERALGDDAAGPTARESAAAAALRDELERGQGLREESAIFSDLNAAYRPSEISEARNEELIARALRGATARGGARVRRIPPVTMAALAGVTALAAGVALVVGDLGRSAAPVAAAAMVHARSTDDLFDPAKKFEVGEQSARIDRIASARAADLRQNRFAAWGVR